MNVKSVFKQDGLLGFIEKVAVYLKKLLFTFYYRLRFKNFGLGSVVTGAIDLKGSKHIRIGKNVVIEAGARLECFGNGIITIGDDCFIERGAHLVSNDTIQIGRQCSILRNAMITSSGEVVIQDEVWIARDCMLGSKEMCLENNVILGPGVYLFDSDHDIDSTNKRILMNSGRSKKIHIKANAWIGAKSVVLKGVEIGQKAVIGAGSVVNQSISDSALAVGVPAKEKKKIFES